MVRMLFNLIASGCCTSLGASRRDKEGDHDSGLIFPRPRLEYTLYNIKGSSSLEYSADRRHWLQRTFDIGELS